MSNQSENEEEDTRRLVVAITDFLRDQLLVRTDMVPEDRDCLEIAIQCLEMAYGLEAQRYVQHRCSRPLLEMFNQVTNPVSIKDKLRADALKDEGNSYMRRNMFSNAETEYTNAIELDKWNAIYYCNRAGSRIEQRKYFEAISDCRQALMLNPDYAKAHARMGQSYALIQRPREAARCFRQALELDPSNERYRNNLRVAENQVTRPDAMGIIASLIGSLFGLAPPGPGEESSGRSVPTSFMIITESHPPRTESGSETAESSQTDEGEKVARRASSIGEQNIIYPQPYGVIDEGEEEQPTLQFIIDDEGNEEFQLDFPGLIVFPDLSTASPTDSEGDTGIEVDGQQGAEISQAGERTERDLEENEMDISSDDTHYKQKDSEQTDDDEKIPDVKREGRTEETGRNNDTPETQTTPTEGFQDGEKRADIDSDEKSIKSSELRENERDTSTMGKSSDEEKRKKQTDVEKIPDVKGNETSSNSHETPDKKNDSSVTEQSLSRHQEKSSVDDKDLSIDQKTDNASDETEKGEKENDNEPKERRTPAKKIVSPTDTAMLESPEDVSSSTNDPNTEAESKKESDRISNASSNSVQEKRSVSDNLMGDKEGKDTGMKGESFSSEKEIEETTEKGLDQTSEKEKDQRDKNEDSKKSDQ